MNRVNDVRPQKEFGMVDGLGGSRDTSFHSSYQPCDL